MSLSERAKSFFLNLFVLVVTLLILLVAIEITLRLTVYNFKTYAVSPGPGIPYKIETAEFKTEIITNSYNLRDVEIGPKKPGEYRILCVGDSFTFGLGVNIPESYPKVAEKLLREKDPSFSVLNGGTEGNAANARDFLLKTGLSFQPDALVVQVYLGNDFYDFTRTWKKRPAAEAAVEAKPSAFKKSMAWIKTTLRETKLCTVEFLWGRLIQIPFFDDWLFKMNLRYDNRAQFLKEYPETERTLAKMETDTLKEIKEICDKNGIRMLLLLAPTKQQIFKKHLMQNDKYDYKMPNHILNEFAQKEGIFTIDLLEHYETLPEAQVRKFYFVQDRHWTRAGHQDAAEVLAKSVIDTGIKR